MQVNAEYPRPLSFSATKHTTVKPSCVRKTGLTGRLFWFWLNIAWAWNLIDYNQPRNLARGQVEGGLIFGISSEANLNEERKGNIKAESNRPKILSFKV